MPRKNPNISNYHYRADIHDSVTNELITSKYYFTLDDLCKEYCTSKFTIYNIINKPNYTPRYRSTKLLEGVKFYRDYKPAIITTTRKNIDIYGELDDL